MVEALAEALAETLAEALAEANRYDIPLIPSGLRDLIVLVSK